MGKKLTLGAKGFLLESAMTDDGDAMRVCLRRRAWAEGVVFARANQSRTGHRTPSLTHVEATAFPGPSTFVHACVALVERQQPVHNGSLLTLAFFPLPLLSIGFLSSR